MLNTLLFPSSPLNRKEVDPQFEPELKAAQEAGFDCLPINTEALDDKRFDDAVKHLPKAEGQVDCLLRGWMMRAEDYAFFYAALYDLNYVLKTSPAQYIQTHHLPVYWDVVKNISPMTAYEPLGAVQECLMGTEVIRPDFEIRRILAAAKVAAGKDNLPVILKDYVKSEKQAWPKACYIEDPSDRNQVLARVMEFIDLRGERLTGGLVFRRYTKFEGMGGDPREEAPHFNEYRLFFYGLNHQRRLAHFTQYRGNKAAPKPPLEGFDEVAKRVRSNFFTMDIACTVDGKWMVVELGDGQVAGLPQEEDPAAFYRALKVITEEESGQ